MDLFSGFVECLMLVLALEAARRGRPLYWLAFAGLVLVLYARMASGILVGDVGLAGLRVSATALLTIVGLAVAALTVLVDLLFEVVEDPGEAAGPSV